MKDKKHAHAKSDTPTDWGQVARWYDQLVGQAGSEYHREVILPGTLRLLGLQRGDRALDVACGQGVLCRLLHKGGVHVVGIDAAAELLTLAVQRSDPAIQYRKADARDLSMLPAEHFDAAACVLAIQNINPLAPVFENIARCLRPRGRVVLVLMHPCFRSPRFTHWGWDEEHATQYRRVDRYLMPRKEPIVTHPGVNPNLYTWSFHRPMQAYVKTMRNAGLLIDAMEEWTSHKMSQTGPRSAAENQARKEIPMFLALRGVKIAGPGAVAGGTLSGDIGGG